MSDYNRTAAMSGLLAGNETLAKVSDVEYSKVQSYFEIRDARSSIKAYLSVDLCNGLL